MLSKIIGKKVSLPAKYGTITRRFITAPATDTSEEEYFEVKEEILLREGRDYHVGGVICLEPIYETRSEKILKPERTYVDGNTGQKFVVKQEFVTRTTRVIKGYQRKIELLNLFKPMVAGASNAPKAKLKFDVKKISVLTLKFFLPKLIREEVVGDILEDFKTQKSDLQNLANIWLVKEVTLTLFSVFIDWVARIIRVRS